MTQRKLLRGRLEYALDFCIVEGEKPAILLIDVQEKPFGQRYRAGCHPVLNQKIQRQREVLAFATRRGIDQYLIELPRKKEGPTLRCLREVMPEEVTVVTKRYYSALEETALERNLDEREITLLLLMGWHTAVCLLKTARAAYPKFDIMTAQSVLIGDVWDTPRKERLPKFYLQHCRVYDDL